jgi:hypothetical protein
MSDVSDKSQTDTRHRAAELMRALNHIPEGSRGTPEQRAWLAAADLVESVRCELGCDADGMRDPYCSLCRDSTWDHECPSPVPCEHTVAYRNALRLCRAYLNERAERAEQGADR